MTDVYKTFKPEGFTTINTYLFIEKPEEYITFLKNVFEAEELSRITDEESGIIRNCILKIGDSCFMISQAEGPFLGMRTALYLYVSDTDTIYKRALEYGAKSVFEPADMDYGDRQGGVEDIAGNYWWVSTRLVKEAY